MKPPQPDERTMIMGMTGSGKTRAGLFHLSRADYHRKPWVIFDYKGEKFFRKLEPKELTLNSRAPTEPGLYIVQPLPHEFEEVEDFIWRLWRKGKIGLFIDEATMLFQQGRVNKAVRAVLTQGRSKGLQVIACSQRPAWLDRFFFSESEKFQVFFLNEESDVKRIREKIPDYDPQSLEEFHSYWHEVKGRRSESIRFGPVPDDKKLLAVFRKRARKRRAVL